MNFIKLTLFVLLFSCYLPAHADSNAPWGTAKSLDANYPPAKALYDLHSGNQKQLTSVLDRIGYLYKLYDSDVFDSSIIVVLHGSAIPLFAVENFKKYSDIINRAQSLTVGTTIEFRMCKAAAKLLGYKEKDIHGFVKMVPMADAEIIRLQHNGYAYMN